ncbi:glucose-6-phosphate dehydrogenase assembly protein OpcA [Streptomyces sp. NPDC004959]|uniref:glucose-6-phosphate dehydrogenase assembly protein OpcA n=1 Tax=unclassified Streptomyces TaxID=2593676 RepID=UPI0033B9DAF5
MRIDLTDTTSSDINKTLVSARRALGTPTVGRVLTLLVVTDEEDAYDALRAAGASAREHPARILLVIRRTSRSPHRRASARLDAEVRVGADDAGAGEIVVLRLYGEVGKHADSVVLPLLLPDVPVVAWWPYGAPEDPAGDPLGALARRRITDAYASENPVAFLAGLRRSYTPGDTDLAWTRLTLWRSTLAAALDQVPGPVRSAVVESEADNPSAELLARWLGVRLGVEAERVVTGGPVITAVRLGTAAGELSVERPDGPLASLTLPGRPPRPLALQVRALPELLSEELRRLDPDEAYAEALHAEARTGATS